MIFLVVNRLIRHRMINSFSARLSIYILGITAILFVLSFSIYFRYSSEILLSEVLAKQDAELEQIVKSVDTIISEVELSVESAHLIIDKLISQGGDFTDLQQNFIRHNDAIMGMAIAFEPYQYDRSKRYFMQYTMRNKDRKYSTEMVGDEHSYDYHTMEWYVTPKSTGEAYWCEPYFDAGAGGVPMTTYSVPLHNKDGLFIGVATADISLEWITKIIAEYSPYPNSYSYMLSRNGHFLSHKDPKKILNETFFSATCDMLNEAITEIGQEMLAQRRGYKVFTLDGTSRYSFYAPIKSTGWSVGTVSFKSDIFSEIDKVNRNFWLIISCGLLLIFTLTILVIRRATRPLVLFARSADDISSGDFDAPLPVIRNRDEMHRLREAFANMQGSLKSYIAELQTTTAARERIESELSIATQIQSGLLPHIFPPYPNLPNVELFATLIPAKEVGGDLYDFFADGDTLYFTVGDASGKGVPASLLMAVTSSLFRSMAKHLKDPAKVLESMNNSISEKNEACMFITLFVGALNVKTGELLYSSAGHNAPILIRDGEAQFIDVTPNIPLGVMSDMEFVSHKTVIRPDDLLFLYSDGLTEAENGVKELYSDERLLGELSSLDGTMSPKEALDRAMKSVHDFVKESEQSDDLTMLAVKLKRDER